MGRIFAGSRGAFRQWRYPREFRIAAPAWPADVLAELTELARLEAAAAKAAADAAAAEAVATPAADTVTDVPVPDPVPEPVPEPAGLTGRSLAEVATSLWRLSTRIRRMDDPPRALVRNLEAAQDALTDAGVEIKDHIGEPFDLGLVMSVAAYQPTPGLRREQIIETLRPGVYLDDRSIQVAEVIVGTPEPAEEPTTGAMEETRGR
ncbi:hypothetical protein [Actinomadura sp. WMMB 499]|uniref:hypothetical protein n=1 Tax=Actinomadura sp. WMMB 499 TaxID=1219491 RepID=UPI0012440099|nr:hypothetical protein [Actinomadura sp. WMMB 499]QFG24224.1 hypothetical protein F7P10_26965 [Actinomadura sp. WMMB 499]